MRNTAQHLEWRSLIEISGPFLAASVLESTFPQGLDAVETPRRRELRAAYEEWRDAVNEEDPLLPQLHQAWIRLVLTDLLEYDSESLVSAADWVEELPSVSSQENTGIFSPDWLIHAPGDEKPRLFIAIFPPDTNLESSGQNDGWPASLLERMTLLCRAHGVRLGLLSNGERWMLVNAPEGSTSGHASWYARLWFQEPLTLKAFRSLLGVRRCFGPAETTLEALLEESLKHQEEVTDTLGSQVRRAVEVLIQCLDKADEDRNRELLRDVPPAELYEAGLTVMMRLVFILCAEERGLLLSGDPLYDQCYAVSTLRGQLSGETPEILERRHDAWARLLAIFRGVYGGIEHENLRLPALGGSLFDPDRFPFLEGRAKGTRWRDVPASPLPIDNRTVLLLLNSLQILEQSTGALLLSYRALDVEQIGHVYEGLLEHTVARVPKVTLGLQGTQSAKDPNITLAELESVRMDGAADLVKRIREITGRSVSAIKKDLEKLADEYLFSKVIGVCGSDMELAERIQPFTNLLRTDAWEDPIIYRANSFMVTLGADRRETGTHYTPKSLTESIVSTTLEPIVYSGPSDGKPREEWVLKSPQEILDLKVCDPAMGSGAFLVQACRYLGERLVEAWLHAEENGKKITIDGEICDSLDGAEPMSLLNDERLTIAKRLVAERCLYGVDINPLAVELAKLSIWLVTLAKGRPFGFLDHNFRPGDSLLGIHRLDQLIYLTMTPDSGQYQIRLFGQKIKNAVQDAIELRKELRAIQIRDIHDVETMSRLDQKARKLLLQAENIANAMLGEVLKSNGKSRNIDSRLNALAATISTYIADGSKAEANSHTHGIIPHASWAKPSLHWPLEFPEVFESGGFNAVIGNPPFLGNRLWKKIHGDSLQQIVQMVLLEPPGKIDLSVVFHRRVVQLLRDGGTYGMLATNNISEGSALSVGLARIVALGNIYCSVKSLAWPGKAAVIIAMIFFIKGNWRGLKLANGKECSRIGERLEPEELNTWKVKELKNAVFSFEGVNNSKGLAFVITSQSPWFDQLKSEKNSLLRPYITGDDITSSALTRIERWALDIADRSLEEIAQKWPVAHRFLVKVVQPTRTPEALKSYKGLYDRWWQFWNTRAAQISRLRKQEHFIAYSKVTKYPICMLAPSGWIYTNKVLLIEFLREDMHTICLSSFFRLWLENFSGGRLEGRLTLSIQEAVNKFPLPKIRLDANGINAAKEFNDLLVSTAKYDGIGLTQIINHFSDNKISTDIILHLRALLAKIDRSFCSAYGWDDIKCEYDFVRSIAKNDKEVSTYTLLPSSLSEANRRLIELNRVYYEEE
ncbi:MAG: hypothetical protein BCS36_11215 [Desulfovibrio sp. MES5]|uniref:Eco57I restriction-modification methylase domain-containing protein n=1 Tax=Desulfovibrio sp. MES5 TaxID=1899016 RepID=UPI000B9C8CC9|nr:type IIL restriction-modification enzyme MmeI [Desulfovibrio sp. MES5]OXS27889.1 MAG: hypothetical protein BCS36_11215 [Desulfovibrio sp. MES5]